MAMLIIGGNAQEFSIRSGWKTNDVIEHLESNSELPAHNRALTLKADGVVLGPKSTLPKDVLVLEVVETHDPSVVGSGTSSGPETLPSPELSPTVPDSPQEQS